MIQIRDKYTREPVGELTAEELQALTQLLERGDSRNRARYIEPRTIEYLEKEGAPASLLAFLRKALGDREHVQLTWRLPGDRARIARGPWVYDQRPSLILWVVIIGPLLFVAACLAASFYFGLDADVTFFGSIGLTFILLTLFRPRWFWEHPKASAARRFLGDRPTIALYLALGLLVLGLAMSRAIDLRRARIECEQLLAGADYFQRRERLAHEPIPSLSSFPLSRVSRPATCAALLSDRASH